MRHAFPSQLLNLPILSGSVSALLLLTGLANAAPIATDSFQTTTDGSGGTYNSTTNSGRLYDQNPSAAISGFTGSWSNGNTTATSDLRTETTGLTHALLQGTAQTGDIFAIRSTNNSARTVTHALSASVNTAISDQEAASGEIWFSSLFNSIEAPLTTNPIVFGLSANADSTGVPSGVTFGLDDGALRLYVNGTQTGSSFTITTGVTYLVAAQIDFTAGGALNDSVTLQIFNATAPFSTPTATITASGLTIDPASLTYLAISRTARTDAYTSDSDTPRFDEFRLGLLKTDVMSVPEPGTAVLVTLGLSFALLTRRRAN